VSFETEFIAFGGLGAVMKLLPNETGPDRSVVIAPYFSSLINLDALAEKRKLKHVRVLFDMQVLVRGIAYTIEVTETENPQGLKTFLIGSDDFFNAAANPYVNPCNPARPLHPFRNPINGDRLTEDALFFSIVVPSVLAELVKTRRIRKRSLVLHLQDWETAPAALAVRKANLKPAITSVRSVLTIHNPYDRPLHRRNSLRVCDFAAHIGLGMGRSILEQVIPVLDAPVSTVSRHFAHELRNEPLYTQIFCPHLQRVFKSKGLIGIDNGIFGKPEIPFSATAVKQARGGVYLQLLKEKKAKRIELSDVLGSYMASHNDD
jgi:glycogen synthase